MPQASSPESLNRIRQRITRNLAEVQRRIDTACERSGRTPAEVKLVVVTKYTPIVIVAELYPLQLFQLGENRPQQLIERSQQLPDEFAWHLIGQLQRNKVRAVLPFATLIHSVDSERLLNHIDRVAGELGLQPQVLLQMNISNEETKSGFSPNEIRQRWSEIAHCENVEIVGLMTMAPQGADENRLRETFGGLRQLRDELNSRSDQVQLLELSMGMSGDFEIAIEEGATYIRLGSSIFAGCDEES